MQKEGKYEVCGFEIAGLGAKAFLMINYIGND